MACIYLFFSKEANKSALYHSRLPSAPTFLTGESIRGNILISHDPKFELPFDTIQLLLRGDITTKVDLKADIGRKTETPILRMSCVKEVKDFQRASAESFVKMISQTEFYFEMPETIMLPSLFHKEEKKRVFQLLPPSIRIVHTASNKWLAPGPDPASGVCDVVYSIQARLFSKGRVLSEMINREIMVMPAAEVPPPVAPEDLRNEYQLSASSVLGIFRRRRKAMSISMSSSEPRPLIFGDLNENNDRPSTELLLQFSIRQVLTGSDSEDLTQPEISDCELTVTLEATTYFLQNEEHSVLSLTEAGDVPFSVTKTTRYKTQRKKLPHLEWKKKKETFPEDCVDWDATVSVFALLPPDAPRLPSFVSALVSRRYAFHVQAKFSSELGTFVHNKLRLKVPVQIVHAPLEKEFYPVSEIELNDEIRAPVYVP